MKNVTCTLQNCYFNMIECNAFYLILYYIGFSQFQAKQTILLLMKCYNALSGNLLNIHFILLAHHAEYSLGSQIYS